MTFHVEFAKILIIFSLFTPRRFIRNEGHKRRGTFFERGGNSQKRAYVGGWGGGVVHCNEQERTRGEAGKKLEVLSERTF